MRVLIAFDKFKDAITAREACAVTAEALRELWPEWKLDLCPLTDGGDGFEKIIGQAVKARPVDVTVTGPRGEAVVAGFSLSSLRHFPPRARAELSAMSTLASDASVAIVEMARASGLALLQPELRDPWSTTTHGAGELIRAAAEAGAQAIILGAGGSATHDLGLGALGALGLKYLRPEGRMPGYPTPNVWEKITTIVGRVAQSFPPLLIATDVANPLLGPTGAAAIYGPQKGLKPERLAALELASARMANRLCVHCGKSLALVERPGTGAAGGITFGLLCATEAYLTPGFRFTSACLNLEQRIAEADLVITGEGRFDGVVKDGKGPGALANQTLASGGKQLHVFAGQISDESADRKIFHALSPRGAANRAILDATAANLRRVVRATLSPNQQIHLKTRSD